MAIIYSYPNAEPQLSDTLLGVRYEEEMGNAAKNFNLQDIINLTISNLPSGPAGPTGPTGAQGQTGAQGVQGIQGEQGVQGVTGQQGIQGETGAALTVLGSYPNLAAFEAGAGGSEGMPGTAWIIESDGSLYVWNTATNAWEDVGDLQGPQGIQGIQGLQGTQGEPGTQGEQGNQGIQGIQGVSGTSGLETWTRYSPTFQATGMTFTGTGVGYPTYNSYYVKSGLLVSFVIEINFTTVTNFGTGQYKVALPFLPGVGYNHFSGWIWADPNIDPDTGTGHTILNADTAGITTTLDLHYLKQGGGANSPIREGLWIQGTPVTLTTISKAYINGTYIAAS